MTSTATRGARSPATMEWAEVAMLVVTANWAVSDGTLAPVSSVRRVARAWLRRVRMAAVRAGFGHDGAYRPPERLDIVLAGDTFDGLVSAAWRGRERPWHAGNRADAVRRAVLIRCTRCAAPLLAGLAALVRRGLCAPRADRRGRPSSTTTVQVPVRVALLAGDRDRHIVDATAGFASRGASVSSAWSDGAVLIRHGHEFDPACHAEEAVATDRSPTLAESVAVDLVARFAAGLDVAGIPGRVVSTLLEALAAAGPVDVPTILAAWLAGDGGGAGNDAALGRAVLAAWHRAVDAWVKEARRVPPDCGMTVSPVDAFAAWFTMDGTDSPPAALADLFDMGRPIAIAPDDRPATVILGHPAPAFETVPFVCLGRRTVRPWSGTSVVRADGAAEATCVAAGAATVEPATIIVHPAGGRTVWRRITGTDGAMEHRGIGRAVIVEAA